MPLFPRNPLSPTSTPVQGRLQNPPAKSKLLAAAAVNFLLFPKVILGFVFIFVSELVMFKALSLGKFSVVIPVTTEINFAFTIGVGILLFKDKVNILQIFGMLLIIMGFVAISYNQNKMTAREATRKRILLTDTVGSNCAALTGILTKKNHELIQSSNLPLGN